MAVTIQNSQSLSVQTDRLLAAAQTALRSEGAPEAEVSILLTGDDEVHALNLDFRSKDRPTDVLSFAQRDHAAGAPITPAVAGEPENLGDVVISVETAARQAEQHGVSLDEELCLLTTHGILHLLGYDDVTDEGAEEMFHREFELGVRAHDA